MNDYAASVKRCNPTLTLLICLQTPRSQEEVVQNQADTLAADFAEARYAANIDFGGISSTSVGYQTQCSPQTPTLPGLLHQGHTAFLEAPSKSTLKSN